MIEAKREYIVGHIRATNRPEASDENLLDDKMPWGIQIILRTMNFTRGTKEEFGASMPAYEEKVAELAALNVDLIRPGGAPPFMLLGFEGEREMIRGWEKKYGVPMFTSGQSHVLALRTLGVHSFVGASYFPEKMNDIFARYFSQAGFQVMAMEGMDVPFADVPKLPPDRIYDHITGLSRKHRDAEGIYLLGSAWKCLEIIDPLEQTLGVPVLHPAAARSWHTQIKLGFRQPIPGYGRLLEEMPEAVPDAYIP